MPPFDVMAPYHMEKLTEDELSMVYQSADWRERMVNIAQTSGILVQNTTDKLKPLRLKSWNATGYRLSAPTWLSFMARRKSSGSMTSTFSSQIPIARHQLDPSTLRSSSIYPLMVLRTLVVGRGCFHPLMTVIWSVLLAQVRVDG